MLTVVMVTAGPNKGQAAIIKGDEITALHIAESVFSTEHVEVVSKSALGYVLLDRVTEFVRTAKQDLG